MWLAGYHAGRHEHGSRFLFGATWVFAGYLKLADLGAALLRQMRDEAALEGIV
jgi:hypothetical protein